MKGQRLKTVVVTGAKGHTGVSIVRLLRASGYEVIEVDLKTADFLDKDYKVVDLEDGASVYDVFAGADAVVHFGSYPRDTQTSWERIYRNLALGGYHVLQASARLGIKCVVMASSPTVWGLPDSLTYLPVDEDHPQRPPSIYGAVKQSLEALASNYARWYGMTVVSFRILSIVYEGSYEWRLRALTETNEAAADRLWGYVDARDVASACRAALEAQLEGHEVFVLSAPDVCVDTPTMELVKQFYPHVQDIRTELEGNVSLYSWAKAKRLLCWEPEYAWRAIAKESS